MGGQEENPLKIKGFLVRETGLEETNTPEIKGKWRNNNQRNVGKSRVL